MEHTTGKLEVEGNTYLKDDSGKVVFLTNHVTGLSFKQQSANAKELVRRWNAFEKDGLVDELRAALKALMAAPETLPPDNEFDKEQRDYRNRCMTRIDEARKLGKAAIAKAT